MPTSDLILKGGKVVTPDGVFETNVVVDEGKITSITKSDNLQADRVVDISGRYLLPGIIDPHTHFGIDKERPFGSDCKTESASAVAGGVTTVINFMMDPGSYKDLALEHARIVERSSLSDFVLQAAVLNETHLEEIQAYVDLGVTSFKIFMNREGRSYQFGATVDDGLLYRFFERIRDCGGLAKLHCENFEIARVMTERAKKLGLDGPEAWDAARPSICEYENMSRAKIIGQAVSCPIYVVHVSIGSGLGLVQPSSKRQSEMTLETCPHYLMFAKNEIGNLGKIAPPIRGPGDREQLWSGMMDGRIRCVGSDHVTRSRKDKRADGDIWNTVNGFAGTEAILPVMLSEGVNRRGLPIEKVAEICAYNPAKIHGIPNKGSITAGYDADFAVVDLKRERKVSPEIFHTASDFTIYDGLTMKGWPVMTFVRGRMIVDDGEIVGKEGSAKMVKTLARATERRALASQR